MPLFRNDVFTVQAEEKLQIKKISEIVHRFLLKKAYCSIGNQLPRQHRHPQRRVLRYSTITLNDSRASATCPFLPTQPFMPPTPHHQ